MPGRLALLCVLSLLLLSTSAFVQSQSLRVPSPEPTLWDHNGSVVYSIAKARRGNSITKSLVAANSL
jgi:hypothetical protein